VNKRLAEGRTSRDGNQYTQGAYKTPGSTTREERLRHIGVPRTSSMLNTSNMKKQNQHAVNNSLELTNAQATSLREQEPHNAYNENTSRNHNANKSLDNKSYENKNRMSLMQNLNGDGREAGRHSSNSRRVEKNHIPPCQYALEPTPNPYENGRSQNNNSTLLTHTNKHNLMTEKKIRPLPLHTKEDVFDEWGAVLRRQDEIDSKIQQDNYDKMRLRQVNYKMDLDKQFQEQQNKKKGAMGQLNKKEEDLLKYQERLVDQKIKQEDVQRNRMVLNQKSDALVGLNDLHTKKRQDQMMKDMERDMHKEKMLKDQMLQERQRRSNIDKKKVEENEYHNMLGMQAKEKQMKLLQDKEADKHFAHAEAVKLNKDEDNRKMFFTKLKDIQDKNDQKHHSLLKFMQQDSAVATAKRDEQNYIKDIALGERKAINKEFTEKQGRANNVMNTNDILSKQLQEK
jgi:hypothetical protein